ncbi:hypothetical protein D3C77_329020 [compost metagenome]
MGDRLAAKQEPGVKSVRPQMRQLPEPIPFLQSVLGGQYNDASIIISMMGHKLQQHLRYDGERPLFLAGDAANFRSHQIDRYGDILHPLELKSKSLRLHNERIALHDDSLLRIFDLQRRRDASDSESKG